MREEKMKPMSATTLLGSLAIVVGAEVPVWAQTPSTDFTGWLCEIDLSRVSGRPAGVPTSVFTVDTRKHCPGSATDQSITIECKALIPGWTGSASSNQSVLCQFSGDQCGVSGFVDRRFVTASLNIDGGGNARLFCKFNPP
jgi:hypothetical protein